MASETLKITTDNIYDSLKTNFGYDNFRPNQLEVIEHVINGDDSIVIMPTGGGKSICFQLPALLLPGLTIVVSPLIALMKDQVDGLRANGISADYMNSTIDRQEQEEIYTKIKNKKLKLLYIAPESFGYIEQVLKNELISLIAIDEAHCISSWGHDFRPAYTQLGFLKKQLPDTTILALTATADKATREDIVNQLNLDKPKRFISSFDRPNIYLEVKSGQKRIQQITKFIKDRPNQSGIIYCLSRKSTETVAAKLIGSGIKASAYHAGFDANNRSEIQDAFLNDKTQVICATIAFGMGIDKSNVRWVIHYNLPKNIEGYYQEIGRSGRDGLVADTLLFYSYADVIQLQNFANDSANSEFQLAKLERMQQFAESLNCRRKALLSYFGEIVEKDCGNCDNCKNPPALFDGTLITQKALSAITRLKGEEQMNNIIDFLRGSNNAYILSKGYQNLKTYGVGNEIAWRDWQHYLIQLLNQGYCEIAFHDGNKIKLTDLSKKVLFENYKVILANAIDPKLTPKTKKQTFAGDVNTDLFESLRKKRAELAKKEGVPAYIIFSDAALKGMAASKPTNGGEFLDVSGVGKAKLDKFGETFISVIKEFITPEDVQQKKETKKVDAIRPKSIKKSGKGSKKSKGDTYKVTWNFFEKGLTVEEIAETRELSSGTVMAHLLKLYEQGKPIDLKQFVDKVIIEKLRIAKKEVKETTLKPYFDHFKGEISYDELRVALFVLDNEIE